MANLIITILAILLVAVAAIMGVFYGGKAFQESSAKGYAGSVANILKQFDGAGKYWQLEQNGGANIHGNYTPAQLNGLLYPRYISTPATAQSLQVAFYIGNTLENGVFYMTSDTLSEEASGIKLTKSSCRAMEFLRRGVMPSELRVIGNLGTDNLNEKFCGQLGCVANEDSDITGTYVAYWRAYGKTDINKSECVDDGSGTGDTSGFAEDGSFVASPSPGPGPGPTPGPGLPAEEEDAEEAEEAEAEEAEEVEASPAPMPGPGPSPAPAPAPGPSPAPTPGPALPGAESEDAIPWP